MKPLVLRRRRFFLTAALVLPIGLIFLEAIQAQFRPTPQPQFRPPPQPQFRPPPQPPPLALPQRPQVQQPILETVWGCSRCGREVGRGPTRPALTNCPLCGARFNNGSPPQKLTPATNRPSVSNTPLVKPAVARESGSGISGPMIFFGLAGIGAVIVAWAGTMLVIKHNTETRWKGRRAPSRKPDRPEE